MTAFESNGARLDGNAAGGALAELFVSEVTVAMTTCEGCGDTRPVGELHAYLDAPGTVLRCASCGRVQIRMVRAPARAFLDLRGVRAIQFELP